MTSRRDLLQLAAAVGLAGLQKRARGDSPPRTFRLSRVAVDGLANPEDLALIPSSDWIITSGGPGAKGRQARTFFVNTRTREVRSAYPDNCTFTQDRQTFGDIAPPEAIRFHHLDYAEVLRRELRFMDATAVSLCMDNDLPIVVFDLMGQGNVVRAVRGERIGTLVSRSRA